MTGVSPSDNEIHIRFTLAHWPVRGSFGYLPESEDVWQFVVIPNVPKQKFPRMSHAMTISLAFEFLRRTTFSLSPSPRTLVDTAGAGNPAFLAMFMKITSW